MRTFRTWLIAATLACGLLGNQPAKAGGGSFIVAQVTADNSGPSVLQVFPQRDSPLSNLGPLPMGASTLLSPDLNWIAVQGYDPQTQGTFFNYRRVDSPQVFPAPVDDGFNAQSPAFSQDSRYLTYTTITKNIEDGKWALNFLDLSTNVRTVLTSTYTFEAAKESDTLFYGVAYVLGTWNSAEKQVLLGSYVPFADGNFQSFYMLDLSGIDLTKGGTVPLPKATPLLKVGSVFADLAIRRDQKALAYVGMDTQVIPDGFEAVGPYPLPFNMIRLLDITTGKAVDLPLDKKQGVGNAAWSANGSTLLFTAGRYDKTDYVVTPRLDSYDPATGTITQGEALTTDPTLIISQLEICGSTLFYVANSRMPDGTPGTTSLFVAPVANPAQRTELAKAVAVTLLQCVP